MSSDEEQRRIRELRDGVAALSLGYAPHEQLTALGLAMGRTIADTAPNPSRCARVVMSYVLQAVELEIDRGGRDEV